MLPIMQHPSGSGRGLIAGGRRTASPSNIIDYITIQSLGDAIDFGDLISNRKDWVEEHRTELVLFLPEEIILHMMIVWIMLR